MMMTLSTGLNVIFMNVGRYRKMIAENHEYKNISRNCRLERYVVYMLMYSRVLLSCRIEER